MVLTCLLEKDLKHISADMELNAEEDFPVENTLIGLAKEGYLKQNMPGETDAAGIISWDITEKGMVYMKDLEQEKYEEKNKIPVYIWAVIIVVAILTFIRLFPRMFH